MFLSMVLLSFGLGLWVELCGDLRHLFGGAYLAVFVVVVKCKVKVKAFSIVPDHEKPLEKNLMKNGLCKTMACVFVRHFR